jgi:hypothetical protein
VCLNDGPPRSHSPLTFAVYGDGKLIWKSKPVSTQDDLQSVNVSVRNVDLLKIQVTSTGDSRAGHAVWLDPRVTDP